MKLWYFYELKLKCHPVRLSAKAGIKSSSISTYAETAFRFSHYNTFTFISDIAIEVD